MKPEDWKECDLLEVVDDDVLSEYGPRNGDVIPVEKTGNGYVGFSFDKQTCACGWNCRCPALLQSKAKES